jgi:hypothetical protein
MEKFWCCYIEGPGGCGQKFPTKVLARLDAERLAKLPNMNGRKVYILEAVEYYQIEHPPVMFHEV